MTNERAPEGSAGAGITRQLIPSQRREKLQLRQAAGAGPRRNGRDGKRREIFDLPTAHSPQPTAHNRVTLALASASSPLLHEHRRLPCFRPLASPAVLTAHVAAHPLHEMSTCGCIAFCWHLGLGDIHFWPFSGQSSLRAQQAESPPPQQRRVRVYTGAAPAAPPRHLAQPWSKGTWRIGLGDQPSRDKERSQHTLFRTLSRL